MKILLIGNQKITISDVQTNAKTLERDTSYVVVSLEVNGKNKEIYLAPKRYARTPENRLFYSENRISRCINLVDISHGTSEDYPEKTLPLFTEAADKVFTALKRNARVLIHCHRGRSRTGSVFALYLMRHHRMSATDAIHVATEALKVRGFQGGIDINGGAHGTYGSWLRQHEKELAKENKPENVASVQKPSRAKRQLKDVSFFESDKRKQEVALVSEQQVALTVMSDEHAEQNPSQENQAIWR